jgi:hypothetical protein
VVHIEVSFGVVIVVPAWMLHDASCAGMEMVEPRASLEALTELHGTLCRQGLRRRRGGLRQIDQS